MNTLASQSSLSFNHASNAGVAAYPAAAVVRRNHATMSNLSGNS